MWYRLMPLSYCTSPLSPNMESLGFGSCCPLMIFTTSCFLIWPGSGSSRLGLKAPALSRKEAQFVWSLTCKIEKGFLLTKANVSDHLLKWGEWTSDLHTCRQALGHSHSCRYCRTWLCWAGAPDPPTGSWVQLKSESSHVKHPEWTLRWEYADEPWGGLVWVLTKLAASVPEGLGVEVRGVHAIRRRVDAGELSLVEVDERRGFPLHHLVRFGLTERRHLPAAVGCQVQHKDI